MVEHIEPTAGQKSWLDRTLSLLTEVRAGEGTTALLLAANLFLFLALYYVLRPVRQSLILSESGARAQSYAGAAQALLLLGLVPAYGALATRVNRIRLIAIVTMFFASNLVIFYFIGRAGWRLGLAFYIWLGIFNLMVPAQLWAFANDIYSNERGKRLFPLVGIGSSLGAWVGAEVAAQLFGSLGPYRLMLIAAACLVVCLLLTILINRRERRVAGRDEQSKAAAEQPLGSDGGFSLVLAQRYLLYIALLTVVLNLVNTLGEFLLASFVEAEAVRAVQAGTAGGLGTAGWIGSFYGSFYATVNLLGFLIQAFLVSRIFKYLGVRGALFILPLIALASYSSMAFFPVLAIVRTAKILENSTDYSIQNTVRQALFLPTSREAKYKAKQAIDSFFWRAGDLLSAVVVFLGTALAFGARQYAFMNIAFVAVWLVLVVAIVREHRKLVPVERRQEAAA
jgi:ATP:ADP antiporter, AAA family